MVHELLILLGMGGGIVVGACVALGLITGVLYLLFWPNPQREKEEQLAIGREVIADALEKAKSQVDVPAEVEQSFITRYWMRLSRLFKL